MAQTPNPIIPLQHDDATFLANRWPLDPDQKTLLLIHGSGQCAQFWLYQVQEPVIRANILALDLPGHGRSRQPGRDSVEDYAAWTMRFIERLKPPNVIPGGLSLGGAVVQQLLLEFAGNFQAAVLINTGARLRVSQTIFDGLAADEAAWLEGCYHSGVFAANRTPALRRTVDAVSRCPREVTRDDFLACHHFDVMGRIGGVEVPVLVVMAAQDQLTPLKYGRFLADRIPRAQAVVIAEAGHFSPLEKPDRINRAIAAFLETLPG
jgi:pimeloyl-ACP methyl ester carboxylesterase